MGARLRSDAGRSAVAQRRHRYAVARRRRDPLGWPWWAATGLVTLLGALVLLMVWLGPAGGSVVYP